MKKIAYKFMAVIGVLVAVSLVSLQILSANIKIINQESAELFGKQVGDLNLIQTINRDYEEIYRVTLCHAMTNAESSMRSYEKQIAVSREELLSSMEDYKAGIHDEEIGQIRKLKARMEAERLPLSDEDPVALDWHNGRRTPDADPRARGTLDGLTLATSAPALFKALVEATAFGSRAINERMLEEGVTIDNIIAIGGIARKSAFVMQTMADVIGVPIRVVSSDQACALGAAMFAAVVAGIHPSVAAAQQAMSPGFSAEYRPDPERHAIYDRLYARYLQLGNTR
jgi:ribulose kinase